MSTKLIITIEFKQSERFVKKVAEQLKELLGQHFFQTGVAVRAFFEVREEK